MVKEKKIRLDMFLCDIHIIITDDPNKCVDDMRLRQYCSDSPEEDLAKVCDGFVFQKNKSDYYVMLPPVALFGTIAHESVHLIGRIFRDRGQDADYGNDEVFAYFVGWIAGIINDFINKVFPCFNAQTE
jgi:hypothetical protein